MQNNDFGRIAPNSMEAEQSTLGSLLVDNEALPSVVEILNPKDFYRQDHQEIYETILELFTANKAIDIITVKEQLKSRGILEGIGGIEYLSTLTDMIPTSANAKYYAEIVKNMSVRRQLIKGGGDIINIAYEQTFDNILDLKNAAMQRIDIQVEERNKRKSDIAEILNDCLTDIDKQYNSKTEEQLFTGFSDFDKVTAGFHPQELTIIAARPGVGKTAFAIQLLLNLAQKKNYGLFVSREMSTLQIGKRILSNYSGVDGQKLRFCKSLNDDDWQKIGQASGCVSQLPVEISDTLSNIQEIRTRCRELHNKNKLDILFIDYLGLLKTLKKCESRRTEIEDISRQCKELSLEFEIPVVVLAQLNRENEKDKREPKLIDLRESGAIEQDADNVVFLHVPKEADETADSFDIKVIISKQRNGPTGYIFLRYFRKTFRFYSTGR